jgi:hypothetical protein
LSFSSLPLPFIDALRQQADMYFSRVLALVMSKRDALLALERARRRDD